MLFKLPAWIINILQEGKQIVDSHCAGKTNLLYWYVLICHKVQHASRFEKHFAKTPKIKSRISALQITGIY